MQFLNSLALINWLWVFLLIGVRFFAFFIMCSLFDGQFFPKVVKALLSFVLALIILPHFLNTVLPTNLIALAFLLAKEAAYGALFGYLIGLIFSLIQMVGAVIDTQRGVSIGLVMNNLNFNSDSVIGKLLRQGFVVYFVSANGLLLVVGILYHSFSYLPINQFMPVFSIELIIKWFSEYFTLAMVLALPVMGILFLVELTTGLISSFIQQLNVTDLAMPIKTFLALFILIFYLSSLYHVVLTKYVTKFNSMF